MERRVDASSEGRPVRVVIREATPSISSADTDSMPLSDGERWQNGQVVSSDTTSTEFQAQLDQEVEREFQFDEGPLRVAREEKLVSLVTDAVHVREHRTRVRTVLRRVLRFRPWKWRRFVQTDRQYSRRPRSRDEQQRHLLEGEDSSTTSEDSDDQALDHILADFRDGWLDRDDDEDPGPNQEAQPLVPMEV